VSILGADKLNVTLVQQGVWDQPKESMPLAAGYLKAVVLDDSNLRERYTVEIVNFQGGVSNMEMVRRLLVDSDKVPDIIAFSVLGWNFHKFGAVSAAFKAMNPNGLVVFGGNHVSGQALRTFGLYPTVDVVINGEGEATFREMLCVLSEDWCLDALGIVRGLSFRGAGGALHTTADRDRIEVLDYIPSPILSGALALTDEAGVFKYDVALMETNRGCPYRCAFCYWGGAVGQKVRAFSLERLRAELNVLGRHHVHTVVLCDANFGMLPADEAFVDAFLEVREQYGYPRALETSWAKNKSAIFHRIVAKLRHAGVQSSFTLALQTLHDPALDLMGRRNMKINAWRSLVDELSALGLECYAELLWGAPGESREAFLEGYDDLARKVNRIAVYPMLLLPNTAYHEHRDQHGIVAVRGDDDDFEYVIQHDVMPARVNEEMRSFLFWARILAENGVLRHFWREVNAVPSVRQSSVLQSFDSFVCTNTSRLAGELRDLRESYSFKTLEVGKALEVLWSRPDAPGFLQAWVAEMVLPEVPEPTQELVAGALRLDILTRPMTRTRISAEGAVETIEIEGEAHWLLPDQDLPARDLPASWLAMNSQIVSGRVRSDGHVRVDIVFLAGADDVVGTTNHEVVAHYMGRARRIQFV
jgi:radical SAM superfamily enzyme YgiQ (UPF0313 family)